MVSNFSAKRLACRRIGSSRGTVMIGWPRGVHGPVKRHPITDVVDVDPWNHEAVTSFGRAIAQRRAGAT